MMDASSCLQHAAHLGQLSGEIILLLLNGNAKLFHHFWKPIWFASNKLIHMVAYAIPFRIQEKTLLAEIEL